MSKRLPKPGDVVGGVRINVQMPLHQAQAFLKFLRNAYREDYESVASCCAEAMDMSEAGKAILKSLRQAGVVST